MIKKNLLFSEIFKQKPQSSCNLLTDTIASTGNEVLVFPRNLINSKVQRSRGRLPRHPLLLVALLLCFGAGVIPHFTDGETETWKIVSDRAEICTLDTLAWSSTHCSRSLRTQ